MTAERSEAGTHLSPANAGPKASLNRPACSKNQSMQTGTLVVPEGGLNAPSQRHHDPRSVESSSAQPVLLDRRGTPVAAWPLGTKRTPLLVLYLFFFRITSRTAWTNFERKWMRSDIRSEATSRPAGQPEGCPLHLGWSGWGDLNSCSCGTRVLRIRLLHKHDVGNTIVTSRLVAGTVNKSPPGKGPGLGREIGRDLQEPLPTSLGR